VERRAAFDAWLHTECGLTFQDAAQYTPQELTRLQLGHMIQEGLGRYGRDGSPGRGPTDRKRELRRGQEQARDEMYKDLGIH